MISSKEYKTLQEKAQPKTNSFRNLAGAFFIGGAICALGQAVLNFYLGMELSMPLASSACSITLIGISAVLTGFGLYDKIAKFGGGGTLVPITGFANAVVSPAMEFKTEGLVLGLGVKIFSIAGPVIVYGTLASVLYGAVIWLLGVVQNAA